MSGGLAGPHNWKDSFVRLLEFSASDTSVVSVPVKALTEQTETSRPAWPNMWGCQKKHKNTSTFSGRQKKVFNWPAFLWLKIA